MHYSTCVRGKSICKIDKEIVVYRHGKQWNAQFALFDSLVHRIYFALRLIDEPELLDE